jgi:lipid-binding SYLF domain-containing protein
MSALSLLTPPMKRLAILFITACALLAVAGCNDNVATTTEELGDAERQKALADATATVERAEGALANLTNRAHRLARVQPHLKRARAVIIFPGLFKGGLIFGVRGGTGVLLVKQNDGSWSPPSFISATGGDFGFFAGGEVSEVLMTVMNDGALDALLRRRASLGGDVSVAVVEFGVGAGAGTTTNFRGDVLVFSETAGLYGGFALTGGVVFPRREMNQAFYNAIAAQDPEAIVLRQEYSNPASQGLQEALAAAETAPTPVVSE